MTNAMGDGRRAGLVAAATFAAFVVLVAIQAALRPQNSLLAAAGLDFRAFYCSGSVANAGADPSLVEPLRACEHGVQWAQDWPREMVIPSPLPPYDLAAFAALAHLPYAQAKIAWYLALVGAIFWSAYLLARMTRLPALFVIAALLGGNGLLCLVYGQLPPLVVAALTTAAWLVERRRYAWAGVAAAAAMIEPHLGLPACLAMLLLLPRARAAVLASLAALAAVGTAVAGWPQTVAYFAKDLPIHAASELVATDQYSLSHLLHVAGMGDRAALLLGSLSYLFMLAAGIVLARRVCAALGREAFVVSLPTAVVLFGGSFIHETQFVAALPAALLLAAAARRARWAAWTAVALLSVSWFSFSAPAHALDAAAFAVGLGAVVTAAVLASSGRAPLVRAAAGACAACAVLAMALGFRQLPGPAAPSDVVLPAAVTAASAQASANWAAYLRGTPELSVPSPRKELEKVPSWLAIVLLAFAAGAQPATRRREEPLSVPERIPTPALPLRSS